jgi:hypothetical protein
MRRRPRPLTQAAAAAEDAAHVSECRRWTGPRWLVLVAVAGAVGGDDAGKGKVH